MIGMDWLEAYSLMQVDWRNKWLAVPYDGQVKVLQGLVLVAPHQMLLHIEALPAQPPKDSTPTPIPAPVQQLLQEFQDLFSEPTSLPPSQSMRFPWSPAPSLCSSGHTGSAAS